MDKLKKTIDKAPIDDLKLCAPTTSRLARYNYDDHFIPQTSDIPAYTAVVIRERICTL